MSTIFDTVTLEQLRTRTSEKWRHYPADVLPLFVAEMDVPQAEPVVRAVHDAMLRGDTGYPSGHGYAEAFAGFAAARWGWDVDVAATRMTADVMVGVTEVVCLLTDPGDAVVINPPVYPPFTTFLEHSGRHVLLAPLTDGRLDVGALDDAFGRAAAHGRRAAHLLCNPQNPTGTLHTAAELRAIGALSRAHGVRVVSDEIHAPLVPTPGSRFVPATTQIPDAIALHSASKAFNLAGLRAAIAVPGPEAVADLARLPKPVADGVMHLGVLAQTAAYAEGGAFLDAVLDGLVHNGTLLGGLLAPVVDWSPPEATYFAWLDLSAHGTNPAKVLLDRGRLAVNPGPTFGTGGAGRVRLNFATSTAVLTEAAGRLAAALQPR